MSWSGTELDSLAAFVLTGFCRLRGGNLKENTPEEKQQARRYYRFYMALQLRDLCNEVPIHRVAQKYDMPRGSVQTLAQTCEGFAAGMIKFCENMDWGSVSFSAFLP